MRWRRRLPAGSAELASAVRTLGDVVRAVEDAKGTLLLAVPSGRTPRIALAEALLGFEEGIRAAMRGMPGWRVPDVEDDWRRCVAALEEAAGRAERLRVEGGPAAYEELVPALDALLEPLLAFGDAVRRFRDLGA